VIARAIGFLLCGGAVATYVLREHHRGRQLAELREDPFVRNRLSEADGSRLLEHPEVVYALADDIVALGG
jgi:hypothetical protein